MAHTVSMINRVEEFDRVFSESPNAAFIRERVGQTEFVHVYGDVDLANVASLNAASTDRTPWRHASSQISRIAGIWIRRA